MTDLPAGWARRKVRELGLVQLGRQRSPDVHRGPSMRPYLRVANVYEDRLDLSDVMEMHFSEADYERFRLEPGDILLNEGQTRELVGRPAMYKGELPGVCFTNSLIRFRPRTGVLGSFALYQFRHWMRAGNFTALAQITTNIAHLGAGRFAEMDFLVPPLNEQRRIVTKLEALQARSRRAREALDAVPPLLEKLRQSILAAAFRGDLTKDWRAKHKDVEPASELLKRIRAERKKKWEEAELAKMKAKGKPPTDDKWKAKYKEPEPLDATGLPELPRGWCWASLGELADIGTGATPKRGESRFYDGGTIRWVTSGALNDEFVTEATELVTGTAVEETNLTVYPPGTLLLAMYGEGRTRGMVAELCVEAATNQAIAAICLTGIALKAKGLVRLSLERNYSEIRRLSIGGVQPNLNLEKVRGIVVPLCPAAEASVVEQAVEASAERLARVGAWQARVAESRSALEQSILAKAFRGELVPQDPNDEPADVMLSRLAATKDDAGASTRSTRKSPSKRSVRA